MTALDLRAAAFDLVLNPGVARTIEFEFDTPVSSVVLTAGTGDELATFAGTGAGTNWSLDVVLPATPAGGYPLRVLVNGDEWMLGVASMSRLGTEQPTATVTVNVGAAQVAVTVLGGGGPGGDGTDPVARAAAEAAQETADAAVSGLATKADAAALASKVDDDDPRLTDARTPTSHTQAWSTITDKPSFGSAATADAGDFAQAAQGDKADSAVQPGDLADVATTGAYNDLTGRPTLGTAAAQPSTAFATAAQGTKADNAVPATRTVNDKALSANVTLTAADVVADQAGSAALALGVARSEILASDQRSGVVGFDPRPLRPQRFRFSRRSLRNIVVWGDSVFEGDNGGDQRGFGPSLIDLINNEAPGTRQPGVQTVWGWPGRNWSFTGTWLAVGDLPTAWDASPSIKNATLASMGATDSTAAATWTKPSGMAMTEFDILWTRPTTVASAWSYRLDGGAWVNVPFVSGNPPVMEKITVTGNPTTIDFRAQSSAGAAGKIPCLHGIWPRNGTTGTVVHNWSKSGARLATTLGSTTATRTTMWGQWFTMYPADLVIYGVTNDSTTNPASTPASAAHMETELQWLTTQNTDVLLVGQLEQNMVDRTFQQAWRDAYKAMAVSNGWGYVDAFSRFGTFTAANAAGLMRDNVHPSERGGQLMAAMVARYIANA